MNLAVLPDCRAVIAPGAAAVTDDNIELDNAAFVDAVRRATTSLRAAGVSTGDVLAVVLPDTAAFVVTLFAAWRVGAAVVPLDPALPADEAGRRMDRANTRVLVAAPEFARAHPGRAVVAADRLTAAEPDTAEPARVGDDAPALLLHVERGGADAEIAVLDHMNLNALCRLAIEIFAFTGADHSLTIQPLCHVDGIALGVLAPLLAGGCTTIAGPFDPATFFDRIEAARATCFAANPPVFRQLSELSAGNRSRGSSVRIAICSRAHTGPELRTAFEHRYGIPIMHDHGLADFPPRTRPIRPPNPGNRPPARYSCRAR
ncbi:AMP-binding protein [Nocardia testacea]|uniref:AMP-binding protein n=1 Tax=Nocardia testacea TaxID=248551 RepID=UPI0006868BAD|nr:AMP-binding protein [Nocardia testacea]